jgi:hypothetical protein
VWDDSDPTPRQIHGAFLRYIEDFHQQHGYERDFSALASALGIRIEPASVNKAFVTPDGEARILLDASTAPARLLFSALHEIAHHLFWRAYDGELKAYLDDHFYRQIELVRSHEEEFCYEAAALLLMPTQLLQECIKSFSYSPLAVFALAEQTGASHQAALRRVVYAHDIPVHAVLVSPDRRVLDSVSHGQNRERYLVGKDFLLEADHPLVYRRYTPAELACFDAPVPFKGGSRTWNSRVLAALEPASGRILGFFMDSYPINHSQMQPLF